MNPADKRLAVMVSDHPIEYFDFEGIIPPGQYGAGPVVVWDHGTFEVIDLGDPGSQLKAGKFAFFLKGRKLKGAFALARLAKGTTGKEWLLMKKKDPHANSSWTLKSDLTATRLKSLAIKTPPCETS